MCGIIILIRKPTWSKPGSHDCATKSTGRFRASSSTPSVERDMFYGKFLELRATLAFRLTLWYAGSFAIFSTVAFLLFYTLITSVLQERIDQDLLGQAQRFSALL